MRKLKNKAIKIRNKVVVFAMCFVFSIPCVMPSCVRFRDGFYYNE